ncbi:Prolyl oligopeptidase family protein [Lachnospiraceae bacterium NK3A20]|jgi:predicted peptidase|nr:Prolyl oligopeptidase family protein [Lachnospiraceae bacterium NK3A20]
MKEKKIVLFTYIGDYGQMVERIKISPFEGQVQPGDIKCENVFTDVSTIIPSKGVLKAVTEKDELTLYCDPFLYRTDFCISGAKFSVTKDTATRMIVKDADLFEAKVEDGVVYRLFSPETSSPRPLILFCHGGGECGSDNLLQLTGTLGAIKLAKRFPDMYVMAPQAPDFGMSMEEAFAKMQSHGDTFKVQIGADTDTQADDRGWNRDYCAKVCGLIRKMIQAGKVDGNRVYVIGMSMGGAGTINMVSTDPELFAAAAPICPSMNGDSYPLLANWPEGVPVFITTAYIDHSMSRHAYILKACSKLWAEGRKDVRFDIYTQEELEAYGIVADPRLSTREVLAANHNSWVLTLHNEHGVLDWMIAQHKN